MLHTLLHIPAYTLTLNVPACAPAQIYAAHSPRLPQAAAVLMLDALADMAGHARDTDADLTLRQNLAAAQADGKVRAGHASVLLKHPFTINPQSFERWQDAPQPRCIYNQPLPACAPWLP